jgi:hypothetical protein
VANIEYNAEAARIIDGRITRLRQMAFAEAAALPEVGGEDVVIAGMKASVTVFRQHSPYQLEGRILVTVLVARTRWFGMVGHHIERGLVFSSDADPRDATEIELQNSGG